MTSTTDVETVDEDKSRKDIVSSAVVTALFPPQTAMGKRMEPAGRSLREGDGVGGGWSEG